MTQLLDALAALSQMMPYVPPHVAPWLTFMQVTLIVLPFAFFKYRAARMMILAQIVNFAIGITVFMAEGNQVTKLFGLGHVAWIYPMWLFARDVRTDLWTPYRVYAGIAALTIAISLVLDVRDTALWVAGDRGTTLVGLPEGHPLAGPSGD